MFYHAAVFFLIALFAGVLAFGVIAGTTAALPKILFVAFLVSFIAALLRDPKSSPSTPSSL